MEPECELCVNMLLTREILEEENGAVCDGGEVHGDDGVRGSEGEEELPASPPSPPSPPGKATEVVVDAVEVVVDTTWVAEILAEEA